MNDAHKDLKQRIVQSGLLDREELDSRSASVDGDQALLDVLVAEKRITEFEAGALAAGFTGPFMLGPYRVHERIAAGRLGDLFRGVHVDFDQPVSLKVFSSALASVPNRLAQMQREIRVAVQLDHPNLIRSFQISRIGNLYFMALEDLRGETLDSRLSRLGKLPLTEVCRLGHQAVSGLESLHAAEIAHRDLRPSNLWINEDEQLKIMEFGAARDALSFLDHVEGGAGPESKDAVHGDCRYLAPEAAANPDASDARSDVYSLGCVLYQALAGQPPFPHSDPIQLRQSHASEVPTSLTWHAADCPQSLAEMIARTLAKMPDERPTLGELKWELARHFDDSRVGAPVASWSPEFLAWAEEANLPVDDSSPVGQGAGLSDEFAEFLDWLTVKQETRA